MRFCDIICVRACCWGAITLVPGDMIDMTFISWLVTCSSPRERNIPLLNGTDVNSTVLPRSRVQL